ncbi:hypothetical protein Vretifemale_3779, partial [Volvox reticuliferus]
QGTVQLQAIIKQSIKPGERSMARSSKALVIMATPCVLLAVTGLLLLVGGAAAAKPTVTKNCVRLVGGSGGKGRVEITSAYLTPTGGSKWIPLCEGGLPTAQIVCELLGFKYGSFYTEPSIQFPANSSYNSSATSMYCIQKPPRVGGHRHMLREVDPKPLAIAAAAAENGDLDKQHQQRDRSLSETLYPVSFPKNAPYECYVRRGNCHPDGPFAAVECTNDEVP